MKKIVISDISLKECLKNKAFNFTFKEKLEIAKRLCELGVDVIEISAPTEDADKVLIKTICACVKDTCVSLVINKEEELNAIDLISLAKSKRVSVSVPVSPVLMEYFSAKRPKAILEYIKNITLKAKEKCANVEVNLLDATRADVAFLKDAVNIALESGATSISLTDISGALLPKEFALLLQDLYAQVPNLKGVTIGAQLNNAFDMAMPSIFEALELGVTEIKSAVISGLGLIDFESMIKTFESLGSKKGYQNGVNKTAMNRILSRLQSEIYKNGAVASSNDKVENKEIDKNITESEFETLIKDFGFDLTKEDVNKVWVEYNRLAEKKNITLKDLEVIVSNYAFQVPETYVLDRFSVNSSNVLTATASVVVLKDGKSISGLSYGNGAVDACFKAIESIAGEHFELDNFEIGAVTEGREALGKAIVKLRAGDKVFAGRGISTDVIGASIRAYVDALNKIAYERGNK